MTTLRIDFNDLKVGEKYTFVFSNDYIIEGVVDKKNPQYVELRDYSEKKDADAKLNITKQYSPGSTITIDNDGIKDIFVYSNPKLPGLLNKYVNNFGGKKRRKTKRRKYSKKTRRSRHKRRSK
jgi:hypothetical protein